MTDAKPDLLSRTARFARVAINRALARNWRPHSRLFLYSDRANWVLDWELREIGNVATALGIRCLPPSRLAGIRKQSVFFASMDQLLGIRAYERDWHIGAAMFHGRPGEGNPAFDRRFAELSRHHAAIERLQVSNRAFRDIVLQSGIAPEKVFLIPIGVHIAFFPRQTPESRSGMRKTYGLPQAATVVGSFQKDGDGWGEGMAPKMVKGPDVFLETVRILQARLPDLYVLLSGPARGYVKKGLQDIGIPFKHIYLDDYSEIGKLYQCLDAYVVASRDEGGPKAILESMASGVPIVSTRVGQAVDIIEENRNGWLCDIGDAEALAHWTEHAVTHRSDLTHLLDLARQTAESHAYDNQHDLWREFFSGFVSSADGPQP